MADISRDSVPTLRRLMLVLLTVGLIGTTVELVLLEHYESSSMMIPIFLNAVTLLAIGGHVLTGSAGSVQLLRIAMAGLLVAGVIGVVLHYQGNLAFQVEMDPGLSHWELFKKVMHAKAPPALAPGVMAQLGLLGLIYTYRHPALRGAGASPHEERAS